MPNVESIVDKQVRVWSESLRSAEREGRTTTHWPVITVSREYGARGAALADQVNRKIGFTVWNRALVQAIAEDSDASQEIVDSLDERRRKALEDAVMGALMGSKVTNVQYLRSLMRLVQAISAHGSAIIVGRGANYILPAADVLRVRVVAPLEKRVAGYALRQRMSEKEARQVIQNSDAERSEFVQFQFRRDVDESSDYDMVINSSTYDLEAMTDLVLDGYRLKFGRRPNVRST
ncbi:MAG: cytidylate kinase-like family protein [Rhodothermia bacterium]|nr:cytidylate kinase-like family protein [Rhodothermia bacterium]